MTRTRLIMLLGAATAIGCGAGTGGLPDASVDANEPDPFDVVLTGSSDSDQQLFRKGDDLFDLDLRDADGLGPLYTRESCGACHRNGARGPGFVQHMAVVEADGLTRASDQSLLAYGNTIHPLTTAGATTPIDVPRGATDVRLTTRTGPPVLGRGYLEAVADSELLRVAAEQAQRSDAIHGRVNHVVYASQPNPDATFASPALGSSVLGRFGVKARIATLADFTADALQNDMGITSPLRPVEFPNPDGLLDDAKAGVDVDAESVNLRTQYLQRIAIPRRAAHPDGAALFEQVQCSACHVPTLHTRSDYPVSALANIDAPLYSDLLLHDLGSGLSDSLTGTDGEAGPQDWRTAPLVGLRFSRTYLHDGRATTVADAIAGHDTPGSEASDSVHRFQALSAEQQQALLDFVQAL